MQALKVMNAKIRLYSLDEGGDAIVYALPNANRWAETILTWDSVDKLNRSDEFQVGSIDWVWPFDWNEVDVTDAFAMNEDPNVVISFMITTTSDNGITFASRERNDGMLSPELVITLDSAEANVFHSSALVASVSARHAHLLFHSVHSLQHLMIDSPGLCQIDDWLAFWIDGASGIDNKTSLVELLFFRDVVDAQ
jgi:hypothetical protein